MSWQSKSDVQTEVSRLAPARAVPLTCRGSNDSAGLEKMLRSVFNGLSASFPIHDRTISSFSRIEACRRGMSVYTRSISPLPGRTRQLHRIAPICDAQLRMWLAPLALRMYSLWSH